MVDERTEREHARRLGELLQRFRLQARMTQRGLGKASGVSWTFVQAVERGERHGKPVTPSPQTLLKLATGLAADALDPHKVNQAKKAQYYQQMMEARGWTMDSTPGQAEPTTPTAEELREGLQALAGAEAGIAFASLAEDWYQLSPDSRRFIMNAVGYVRSQESRSS